MKLLTTTNLVRSFLVVFFAYQSLVWGYSLWRDIVDRQPFQMIASVIFFLPSLLLCVGLLFRPRKSALPAFIFLVLFFALEFGITWFVYAALQRGEISLPHPFRSFLAPLVITLVVVALSFIYQRRARSECLSA